MARIPPILCIFWTITVSVSWISTQAVVAESSTTKLRERVIELEDARDSLQSKYDRVLTEYKTLKGEIRSEIECQKNLDEAHARLAEVDKKKSNVASLEKELQRCALQKENVLVDLHVTESSLGQLMEKYRDLERNARKEDCSMIKKDLLGYRDQAEQCLMFSESMEKRNQELSSKVQHQDELLKDFEIVQESLQKTQNELELAKERMAAMEKDAGRLKVVEREYVRVQNDLASTVSALESSRNELNATKTALNSLLESLDSRLQYEGLKEEHEKEILPFWLNSVVQRVKKNASHAYQTSVQPLVEYLYDIILERTVYLGNQMTDLHESSQRAANALLHPVVLRADSMLFGHASVEKYRKKMRGFLEKEQLQMKMRIVSLREWARYGKVGAVKFLETGVSALSQKVPILRHSHVDNTTIAHVLFNLIVASIVIPLSLFILNASFKGIVYYLRAGTAQTVIADELQAVGMLEESIDYKFSRPDYALQALEQSPSLHQVGLALINLILAEQGNDLAKTFAELEHRSSRTCIDTIIRPGPGRKSIQVAVKQKVYMYVCLLAAVFRDSEESVEQVFKVWNSTSARPVPRSAPSCDGEHETTPAVQDGTTTSSSTLSSPHRSNNDGNISSASSSDDDDPS